ncbi:MAG: hypothetical protein A2Z14_06630 [Chloroflexi bacterium RBG_16_48_8]|nr:MAG: hypothetical protein A2Z14_06630 [Chloroflexi bacterium RBG_16_48_8]
MKGVPRASAHPPLGFARNLPLKASSLLASQEGQGRDCDNVSPLGAWEGQQKKAHLHMQDHKLDR